MMVYFYATLAILFVIIVSIVGGMLVAKILKPANEYILRNTFDPLVKRATNIAQGKDPDHTETFTKEDLDAIEKYTSEKLDK